MNEHVPDRLFARLMQPWTLPESEWPLCREDHQRAEAICALPWQGRILDVGSGDGTLAAMVCSRNPRVREVRGVEHDQYQCDRANTLWAGWRMNVLSSWPEDQDFDGALCCEILEHLSARAGRALLRQVKAACKPGAMVCVTVPDGNGSRATYPSHRTTFYGVSLIQMLDVAGLPRIDRRLYPRFIAEKTWLMAVCRA